jgi:hypothetical protein
LLRNYPTAINNLPIQIETTLRLRVSQSVSQSVCIGVEHPWETCEKILFPVGAVNIWMHIKGTGRKYVGWIHLASGLEPGAGPPGNGNEFFDCKGSGSLLDYQPTRVFQFILTASVSRMIQWLVCLQVS